MNLNFLKDIQREHFNEVATRLTNHYCILKHDSRDNCDIIYRFAEIEFYLYDANELDIDTSTYNRDCKCGEWFLHASGVDIAFKCIIFYRIPPSWNCDRSEVRTTIKCAFFYRSYTTGDIN